MSDPRRHLDRRALTVSERRRLVDLLESGKAREMRERLHYTAAEAGATIGCAGSSLANWESRHRVPNSRIAPDVLAFYDALAEEISELEGGGRLPDPPKPNLVVVESEATILRRERDDLQARYETVVAHNDRLTRELRKARASVDTLTGVLDSAAQLTRRIVKDMS